IRDWSVTGVQTCALPIYPEGLPPAMTTLYRAAGKRFTVELTLNGQRRSGEAEPRMLLCDFLRHELQAFGVHVGCEHGVCGACTRSEERRVGKECRCRWWA